MRRGVGLALVHRLVTRPVARSRPARPAVRSSTSRLPLRVREGVSMIRVLVVDDDYHVAHAHALSVARVPGFAVVGEAHTGAEAWASWPPPSPTCCSSTCTCPTSAASSWCGSSRPRGRVPDFLLVTAARDIELGAHRDAARGLLLPRQALQLRGAREQLEAYRAWVAAARPGARRPTSRSSTRSTACAGHRPGARQRPTRSSRRWPGSSRSSSSAPAPVGRRRGRRDPRRQPPHRPAVPRRARQEAAPRPRPDLRRDRTTRAPLPPPPRLSRGPAGPGPPSSEVGDGATRTWAGDGQANAERPVISRPRISDWIESVPS